MSCFTVLDEVQPRLLMNPTVRTPAASGNSCACAVARTWALDASVTQARQWADRRNETTAHRWTDRWSPWCVSARSGASVKDYPGRGYRLLVDGLPADGPWSDRESTIYRRAGGFASGDAAFRSTATDSNGRHASSTAVRAAAGERGERSRPVPPPVSGQHSAGQLNAVLKGPTPRRSTWP